jgi:hypothetical protein
MFMQLNGLGADEFGRPAIVNAIGALDVDIVMEEGPDVGSLMQDAYEMLKGYPPGTFPPQVLIEMSSLPRADKNRILGMMKPPPNPMQIKAMQLQMEGAALKNTKTAADARYSDARAQKAAAEAASEGAQTQMDAAGLLHSMWNDAAQIAQPPQPPQVQSGQPGMAGQQPLPPHPVMPMQMPQG